MTLTEKDQKLIENKGISEEQVMRQIETFKRGIPFVNLQAAATIGNGIMQCNEKEKTEFITHFEKRKNELDLLKFVPASGAATRMFKALFEFILDYDPEKETVNAYVNRTKSELIRTFFIGIEKFPFYEQVMEGLKEEHQDFDSLPDHYQKFYFVKMMLDQDHFNFGDYPKGLLPFHKYKDHVATAFEEHLYEAALYDASNDKAKLHFTISEDHSNRFDDEFDQIESRVENSTGVSFDISFSYQKESTDTIAVTPNDEPFRLDNGEILFRPGGHGALIENLNEQDADVIFIKNIDNVVVKKYKQEVADYKRMLAGILLSLREKVFQYAAQLEEELVTAETINEIRKFLEERLNVYVKPEFYKFKEEYQVEFLKDKLHAPIRICGMVKNEGEPGGGPFWIKDEDGNISLQIIESAQIDTQNKFQNDILKASSHFNPVDIVCSVKDHNGKKFDLLEYIDEKQAFITNKTKEGREVKALEKPGLWNGGMAHWNTVFVEVPLITFNPVKTVVDLLKRTHQVKDE
ncbi:DUF4301 family protein [Robertkochia aurantiaca]|uniref:DUF4301 family protein n=1 Tax=Robertkochia aurantiaca TaxID=2873700 RepID=UPI001CCD3DBB|nr:DUF4301 family protein [Robertkochia sp. 3YJGBD-33]